MNWSIKPLLGKYYGTEICFDGEVVFKIWKPNYFAKPFASSREIELGWLPEDGCDHTEDQQSYMLAQVIVDLLNNNCINITT